MKYFGWRGLCINNNWLIVVQWLLLVVAASIHNTALSATNPVSSQNDSQYMVFAKTFFTEFAAGGDMRITSPEYVVNSVQFIQYTPTDPGSGNSMGLTGSIVSAFQNDNLICVKKSAVSLTDAWAQTYCSSTYSTDFSVNGVSGGATLFVVISNNAPPQCSATTVSWGVSNLCTAAVRATANGVSVGVVNTTDGASGSAQAFCSSGVWQVQNPMCNESLAAPASVAKNAISQDAWSGSDAGYIARWMSLDATDGTVEDAVKADPASGSRRM